MIVAGRRKELLEEITTEHPGITALVLDVADPASIAHAAENVAAAHPGLNVLVNNAGIMLRENLLDPASLPVAEDHVAVNLLGTIRMAYAFLPLLAGKDDAVVMNVTSSMGFVPLAVTPTYGATKAALHSFSESLRVQLADSGVQVIEVIPPGVRTTLLGRQDDENAREIVVERARFFRDAAANGTYDNVLAMLSDYR